MATNPLSEIVAEHTMVTHGDILDFREANVKLNGIGWSVSFDTRFLFCHTLRTQYHQSAPCRCVFVILHARPTVH